MVFIMKIGAQLYSVRDYTKTLDDFSETLKKIADIGYSTVQVSGTCAYPAQWLKEELEKCGLSCVLTHIKAQKLLEETKTVAEEHKIFGCKYVGIGSIPGSFKNGMTDYMSFVKNFMAVSKYLSDEGLYFMYHNHNAEFSKSDNGEIFLKRLAEDFPAKLLGFTLDTYWVQAGGGDVAWWIRNLNGRVPCVHLKDMAFKDGSVRMAPVGEGNMNFDSIINACADAGTEHVLVEQDDCYGEDPFECLKRSYKYLCTMGLS